MKTCESATQQSKVSLLGCSRDAPRAVEMRLLTGMEAVCSMAHVVLRLFRGADAVCGNLGDLSPWFYNLQMHSHRIRPTEDGNPDVILWLVNTAQL